jgi:hypothetical protein
MRQLNAFFPWILTAVLLVALSLLLYQYKDNSNSFNTQLIKHNLISTMRIHLLEATEAEKNAVLAITDEASATFAAKARQATDHVESSRKEFDAIIHQENFPPETNKINEFNVCWSQYKKLDETILGLAVQNTNIKAQRISAAQGIQILEEFEGHLKNLIHRNSHGNQCNNISMLSYEALTASLKVFALHKPHIEAADDQEMDKIEQSIKSYDESASKAMGAIQTISGLADDKDLKAAETVYQQFMKMTGEVLQLSRMNTNIKSAELSLGKMRLISSQCQEILDNLQKEVHVQGNYSLPLSKK